MYAIVFFAFLSRKLTIAPSHKATALVKPLTWTNGQMEIDAGNVEV